MTKETSSRRLTPYRSIGFSIMGRNLDPDKVTRKLCTEPDTCSMRGRQIPYCDKKSKQGHWTVFYDRRNATYETRLRNLALFFEPKSKQLREILKWKEVERATLQIIVEPSADEPVSTYEFDGKLLSIFTALGFEIVFTTGVPYVDEDLPEKERKFYEGIGFSITGKDLIPKKVTGKLGVEPDIYLVRGRPIPYINQKARRGQWIIHSAPSNAKFEIPLKRILKLIEPRQKQLRQILKWKEVEKATLEIVVQPNSVNVFHDYQFDGHLLNTFTALGVNIVFSVLVPIFEI